MLEKFRTLFMNKHEIEEKSKKKDDTQADSAKTDSKKKKKKKFAEKYEASISRLAERTGMSLEESEECLKEAKARLGVEPKAFIKYRLYELSEEDQAERWAEIKDTEDQRKESDRAERQRLYGRIAEAAGWSLEEAKEQAKRARTEFGISLKEYMAGGYYELSDEEMQIKHQKHLEGIEERNKGLRERNINRLAEILDISGEEADEILRDAQENRGIPPYFYIRYKFYNIPVEEQKEYMSKAMLYEEEARQNRLAIRERTISRVVMRTGWTQSKAEQNMIDAYNKYRITFVEYLNNGFFRLNDEEQQALKEELDRKKKEAIEEERRTCIDDIMKYRGCSEEEAEEFLTTALKKTRISYRSFRRYRFYEIPEDQHEERYKEILAQLRARTAVQIEDNDKYLHKIADEAGWDQEETFERLVEADKRCGASWKDFYAYEFWDLDEELQSTYFTSGMQKALSAHFDKLQYRDIFVNKENFLEKFADTTGRVWGVSNRMTLDEFLDRFKNCSKILYKPSNNGNGGNGIEVFTMEDPIETYDAIQNLPRGIVEEYLIQHPKMSELYPNSVNTIRVATVSWQDEETGEEHFEIAYASLRIGSGGSNVDNFTTGGMVANVDLNTGKTLTAGVNVEGTNYPEHPDTGTPIKGFEIPYFKEGLELVRKSCTGAGIHGYIGWDVAITEHGPVLIEANVDPGNRLLQIPWMPERKGVAYVMEKYLKMTDFYDEHPDAKIQTGESITA